MPVELTFATCPGHNSTEDHPDGPRHPRHKSLEESGTVERKIVRITITDFDQESIDVERAVCAAEGVDLLFLNGGSDAAMDPRAKGTNALVVQYATVDARAMDYLLPELKVISRYGVGVDTIDLEAAEARGITVVNVPDYGTHAVSDHAIALAVALVRNLPGLEKVARSGSAAVAEAAPLRQFRNLTFGLIGFGLIGRMTAHKARGLGFNVIAYDALMDPGTEVEGFTTTTFDEVLACSDVLSLHVPLLASTAHLINAETIAKMKDQSILVNTARGGVVDIDAVHDAIMSGKLLGAGLDVLETEPLDPDSPITTCDRVIITPHAGFYSEESYTELKHRTVQNPIDVLKGRPCANIIVPRAN